MAYQYINPNVPAELNFTDIEGPDGMVSHSTVIEAFTAERNHLARQIETLAQVLMDEFGGPVCDESACEMAVRVLREQAAMIADRI